MKNLTKNMKGSIKTDIKKIKKKKMSREDFFFDTKKEVVEEVVKKADAATIK